MHLQQLLTQANPSFGDSVHASEMRQLVGWAMQYALMSIALGGTVGLGAWIWGAMSAHPDRAALGQRVLLMTCGAALALGLVAPLLNTFALAGAVNGVLR